MYKHVFCVFLKADSFFDKSEYIIRRVSHASRLIDSRKSQSFCVDSIRSVASYLCGRRRADEDALGCTLHTAEWLRAFSTTHNYRRQDDGVGVAWLSPNGSRCVVADATGIAPSLTRNLSTSLALARAISHLIPSPRAIRGATQPEGTCSPRH